jgi:glycosyltransferase involved in cell wall biosynthesis
MTNHPAPSASTAASATSSWAAPGLAPRVSVVVRCYRQAGFLAHAVESVVAQAFRDWEIVIVNDGSPDDTSQVALALISGNPGRRIRLVEQDNAGPPSALNAGVGASLGELILPLDADDALHPVFLERAVAALDADPGASIVLTDVVLFGAKAAVWKMGPFTLEALLERNRLCCTSLYRKALWVEAGGYSQAMELGYEDWDFWIGCAERGHRAVHIRQPLFFYRMYPESADTTNTHAMRHHQQLVARAVLNHPGAFGPSAVASAEGLLAARPLPRRQDLRRGQVPMPDPRRLEPGSTPPSHRHGASAT